MSKLLSATSAQGQEAVHQLFESGGPVLIEVPADMLVDAQLARDAMVEAAAEGDEELELLFLEGTEIGLEDIKAAVRRATLAGTIVPVY